MDCNIITPISGIIGMLIGTTLGWFLNSRSALEALDRQKFLDAGADFRSAFIPEIQKLRKSMSENPTERETALSIIDEAIGRHEAAMLKFRHYVPANKQAAFSIAWSNYTEPDKKQFKDTPRLSYFNDGERSLENEIRKIIQTRIDELLKFTEVH